MTGLNGQTDALGTVSRGDSFFKATWGFNNAIQGYAMGQFCADWLAGKSVPQVLQVTGKLTTDAVQVKDLQAQNRRPGRPVQAPS